MTKATILTALYTIPRGLTPDDVYATVLSAQHERALIETSTWSRVKGRQGDMMTVTLSVSGGIGQAEAQDTIERMMHPGAGITTDYVRATTR